MTSLSPLYEPQSGVLTVQYEPNEQTVLLENPPRFTWIPAQLEHDRYVLQISHSEAFSQADTQTIKPIPYNLYTPDDALTPGTYFWRYALLQVDGSQTVWSLVRRFEVPADLPETPLPSRERRYAEASSQHPRLWLQSSELDDFRSRL
ncbi:hypothetical protein QFZ81_006820 [Paenibacillus sp. V4I9]|nr:hypothetical protein [Paenibacillus sp. V4I9]